MRSYRRDIRHAACDLVPRCLQSGPEPRAEEDDSMMMMMIKRRDWHAQSSKNIGLDPLEIIICVLDFWRWENSLLYWTLAWQGLAGGYNKESLIFPNLPCWLLAFSSRAFWFIYHFSFLALLYTNIYANGIEYYP